MGRPRARQAAAALVLLLGTAGAAQAADPAGPQAAAPQGPAARAAMPAAPSEPTASSLRSLPSAERMQRLLHMVRQDCGSCHGMRLTGGLGPALTPDALAGKPVDSLAATIYHGRPGTPMPGWRSMLTAEEARWIAQQLLDGLPDAAR